MDSSTRKSASSRDNVATTGLAAGADGAAGVAGGGVGVGLVIERALTARANFFAMSADLYSTRWRVLTLLGFAELLGMSLWFSASAVTPALRSIWGLSTGEAGWLTTIVQLGFVGGTATAGGLNPADLFPAGSLFCTSALFRAGANACILPAPGVTTALLLPFLT